MTRIQNNCNINIANEFLKNVVKSEFLGTTVGGFPLSFKVHIMVLWIVVSNDSEEHINSFYRIKVLVDTYKTTWYHKTTINIFTAVKTPNLRSFPPVGQPIYILH